MVALLASMLGYKVSKVNNALATLDRGNTQAAINMLEAFIDEVEAQSGKKITEDEANMLIAFAENVIDDLSKS